MIEKIYIPTLGRVEEQKTYNELPDKYKERVVMVVQEHERPKYKYDVEYLIVPNDIGSSKTREYIFKDGCKRKINFLMIDDQMVLKRRNLNYKELGLPSSWILTEKDYESGHYNDGHKISNTKAKRIATRLTKLDKEQVKDVNYYAINDESQYFYKRENVLNFIKFCEESGGFIIC